MYETARTDHELIAENAVLKQRIQELEQSEAKHKMAEESLKQSEAKYRLVADHIKDQVWLMDLKLKPTYISPSVEKSRGFTFEEIVQLPLDKHLTATSFQSAIEFYSTEMAKALADPQQYYLTRSLELEFYRKDGSTLWIENTFTLIRDERNKPFCLLGVGRDITERKRTDAALRETEKQYRRLADNMQDLVMEVDTSGIIQYISPSSRYLGYEPDEMVGQLCFNLLHPEDREKIAGLFAEALSNPVRPPSVPRYRVISKAGDIVWIEGYGIPLFADDQRLIGGLIVGRNITTRKLDEEKLNNQMSFTTTLLDTIPLPIFYKDASGKYQGCNRAYEEFTGRSREDVAGKDIHDLFAAEMASLYEVKDRELYESQGSQTYDGTYTAADGTLRDVIVTKAIYTDANKNIAGLVGVILDITERTQADAARKKLEERLQQSAKMEALGQLAGGVAHDLNSVLSILSGYSELLLEEIPQGSSSRNHVEKILKSTEKGAAIIQDMLTMARRGVTVSEVIDLNGVVSGYLKSPVFEKLKDYHPHVTFQAGCDKDLLNIKGSPIHLEKTLMNLVSNAADAISGKGGVTIRTENRHLDKPLRGYDEVKEGDFAVLIVSDTGMGIPPEKIDKIFEPFYSTKKMGRSGTGLGLAIVWGTVKDHHGYIDIQTEVGKGTTFTLYFPVTREVVIQPQQKEPIAQYLGHGESVLVVDDNAEQLEIASQLITSLGYDVHFVSSGEEAVEYLKDNKADIMVLDMIMTPGIDGLETYRRVLAINPNQKAIIASGFLETDRVRRAMERGVGAYVMKPYARDKIGIAIRDELSRGRC